MALISEEVPNLVNGVSQQADNSRFPSQASEQVNGISSVIEGLVKRPPTEHIAKLNSLDNLQDYQFVHFINRDLKERYSVVISGGTSPTLKVFDLDGVEQTVTDGQGNSLTSSDVAYLASSTPRSSLKAVTVADFTFLLNKDKTVSMSSSKTPSRPPEALVFVKQSRLNSIYTINLYNNEGDSSPTYSGKAETSNQADSQGNIMNVIVQDLKNKGADNDYELIRDEPYLYVKKKDGSEFKIDIQEGSPESIWVFKDEVQSFSFLPVKGYVGMVLKVVGSPEDEGDDYYVEFSPTADGVTDGFADGNWVETVKPDLEDELDGSTMPHILVSKPTRFEFKPASWDKRIVGDDGSNTKPSFVGSALTDIFFHRDRLGVLAGENMVMSQQGQVFNFFRTTVITLLDEARIDIGAKSRKVSSLQHGIPNSERLVLFASQTQFVLPGDDILTPRTAQLREIGDFEIIEEAVPLAAGNFVFFAFRRGKFSGVNQFSVQPDTLLFEAFDVSNHVPRYLKGDVFRMEGDRDQTILMALGDKFPQGIYVYKWHDSQTDRVQSAWFKFDFGFQSKVQDIKLIGSTLYLVISRNDGTFLEKMETEVTSKDVNSDFITLLDRRVTDKETTKTYDSTAEETTIVLPHTPSDDDTVEAVIRSEGSLTDDFGTLITDENGDTIEEENLAAGMTVEIKSRSGDTLTLDGDWTAIPLWLGQKYTFTYEFTRPTIRNSTRGLNTAVSTGRVQLRRGLITYDNTIFFNVEVQPDDRPLYTYQFDGRHVGVSDAKASTAPKLQDGTFPFGIRSRNTQVTIKLKNDSPFPSNFLSADWEITYTRRSRA